jgi:hypothetical protein
MRNFRSKLDRAAVITATLNSSNFWFNQFLSLSLKKTSSESDNGGVGRSSSSKKKLSMNLVERLKALLLRRARSFIKFSLLHRFCCFFLNTHRSITHTFLSLSLTLDRRSLSLRLDSQLESYCRMRVTA